MESGREKGSVTQYMTATERLAAVLDGEMPDRVPCVPLVYYFAAHYTGTPFHDYMTDMKVFRRAMDICFWEIGPWDAFYTEPITMEAPDYDMTYGAGTGMKTGRPAGSGEQSQILQLPEAETLMGEDGYAAISSHGFAGIALPYLRFVSELVAGVHDVPADTRFWLGTFMPHLLRMAVRYVSESERWRMRGIPPFIGFSIEAPFDTFSMSRGLIDFSRDLRRRADEVEEASMKLAVGLAKTAGYLCRIARTRRFLLLLHRSSNDFISPRQFKDLAYPSLEYIARYLDKRGIVPILHCDGNWDSNLELMLGLPEGTCFQFDSATNIFRAREVLGDRFGIMGDVSPVMLCLASPSEVDEYCKNLVEKVGKNGRFILSSGCEVPSTAKAANVKAMVDAVKKYGWYH
ncbi:MAG TPA: uroporphyrinogen decarboxylase family protein [Candidatus Anoxymicrobiaceae bacterium]